MLYRELPELRHANEQFYENDESVNTNTILEQRATDKDAMKRKKGAIQAGTLMHGVPVVKKLHLMYTTQYTPIWSKVQ